MLILHYYFFHVTFFTLTFSCYFFHSYFFHVTFLERMHRTKKFRTDLPHMNFSHRIFRTFTYPHGFSAREFSAQGSSARIFRTFLNFFLTFFKYVLPIVSINTILFKLRQLYTIKKMCGRSLCGKSCAVNSLKNCAVHSFLVPFF